jgi:phage terminase small subunit
MKLNPKQARFVQEYLVDLNATQAAIRAGYSAKTAPAQAARLLTKVNVQLAVTEGQQALAAKTGITQERVLEELAIIAFSDIKNYLDVDQDTGAIRAKSFDDATMPENASRAVQSMTETRVIKEVKGTKDAADTEMILSANATFKMHDKLKALELLGKHLGMFKERVEHSGSVGGILTFMFGENGNGKEHE